MMVATHSFGEIELGMSCCYVVPHVLQHAACMHAPLHTQVQQPTFEVKIAYSSQGKLLEGASKVWAHVGHSGVCDVAACLLNCMKSPNIAL